MKSAEVIERYAQFSILKPETYRYTLSRFWDHTKEIDVWVMLNPSKADAKIDDPTIRRCMGFTKRWGGGGIVVVNIFPYRSTDPKYLKSRYNPTDIDNITENTKLIQQILKPAFPHPADKTRLLMYRNVILAWGRHGGLWRQGRKMAEIIMANAITDSVKMFRLTENNQPVHPLMLPYKMKLRPIKFRKDVTISRREFKRRERRTELIINA